MFSLSVIGFLIILGPLVIVHELGHYLFARLFNVKAEVFSIGFGPKVWARKKGETELRISAIPLGGYVKLLGEDRDAELSPEERARALHTQKPWKRFLIFFGGPFFNFMMAILVFMLMMVIGEPKVSGVIGRVVHHSAAEQAGFQSGDRVVALDGKPVKSFEQIVLAINESPKKAMVFTVAHPGSPQGTTQEIRITTQTEDGYSLYGESTHVGLIDGLEMAARGTMVGVSDPETPAAKAGLVTGDLITQVEGKPVQSWEELEGVLSGSGPYRLQVKNKAGETREVTLQDPRQPRPGTQKIKVDSKEVMPLSELWGLHSSELFIDRVVEKSPAEAAGIKTGDRLVGVAGREVQSFYQLKEAVQRSGEKDGKVLLRWERDGRTLSSEIVPTATQGRDPALKKTTQFTVGVVPMLVMAEPETYLERVWNPFKLVYGATERVVSFTWRNVVAIQKMLTGDVSVSTLGGPIMIGRIAGESLTRGLSAFLGTMAILSIGLGVLNILPVPVLDGGHLMLLTIEIIRGKPLTLRAMEIIQLVGLSLILLLMAVVIRNDLTRLFYS